jgi:hypothetical protein
MTLDPKVWGPHYWFVLHTIAISYPINPNKIMKKKMYDFIQNLPLFLPIEEIGNNFSKFLNKYPVTPYLDSRKSLMRWVNFIHNKINVSLNKSELTFEESLTKYYENYKPIEIKLQELKFYQEKKMFFIILFILLLAIIILIYNYFK